MNIKKIREIAEAKGVLAGDMNSTDLIRAIQRAEGNAAKLLISRCSTQRLGSNRK